MEDSKELPALDLGRIGYEAYRAHTGGISLATGTKLPDYDGLNEQVREAWAAAGTEIALAVLEELKRTAEANGRGSKATIRLVGDFTGLLEPEQPEPFAPVPVPNLAKPSIGQIVIFHHPDGDKPAIITSVTFLHRGRVNLTFFSDSLIGRWFGAEYGTEAGQWSWPERV